MLLKYSKMYCTYFKTVELRKAVGEMLKRVVLAPGAFARGSRVGT